MFPTQEPLPERLAQRGVTRRSFLNFCGVMAATLALPAGYRTQIAEALSAVRRPVLIWRQFQDCAGNSESILRSPHPDVAEIVLETLALNYHELVMAGSGDQAEAMSTDAVRNHKGKYLVGFDGSPESMREWQLEFGAEIARAVVNYDGPIVFGIVSRLHGGAFVVFSRQLNPNLAAVAVTGARASVIGGAPAAAVVFAGEVERLAASDERILALDASTSRAEGTERQRLRAQRAGLWQAVLAEKRHEFAKRFDGVHSIERAVRMGSVEAVVEPARLRRLLIEAVERGMAGAGHSADRIDRAIVADEHSPLVGPQQPMAGDRTG